MLNHLLLETAIVLGGGGALMEHPAPPRQPSYACIWRVPLHRLVSMSLYKAKQIVIEQWRYGASGVKPTLRCINLGDGVANVLHGSDWRPRAAESVVGRHWCWQPLSHLKECPTGLCRALLRAGPARWRMIWLPCSWPDSLGIVEVLQQEVIYKQEVIEHENDQLLKVKFEQGKVFRLCGDKLRSDLTCFMTCLHESWGSGQWSPRPLLASHKAYSRRPLLADHFKRPWIHWLNQDEQVYSLSGSVRNKISCEPVERHEVGLLPPRNEEIEPGSSDRNSRHFMRLKTKSFKRLSKVTITSQPKASAVCFRNKTKSMTFQSVRDRKQTPINNCRKQWIYLPVSYLNWIWSGEEMSHSKKEYSIHFHVAIRTP